LTAEEPSLGALHDPVSGVTRFRVWAPRAEAVELVLVDEAGEPARSLPLAAEAGSGTDPERDGYFSAAVDAAPAGTLYLYRLHREGDVVERPDPASRHQPEGVHGPSRVVERRAPDLAGWKGLALEDHVLYELHVGTFTEEGTFDAVVPHLDGLAELGVTALELMPVAQFPGGRNWGYDGVFPYAVQHSYGGAEGLRRLVAEAHRRGLAVVLDAVYNHLGPEGNYLYDFGPYFTDRYATPWGDALNYDGRDSGPVRRFFVENAVCWIAEHGLDGLRLDAVHAIFDNSERPFLAELAAAVQAAGERAGRRVHLFAESADNTRRFLDPRRHGGCGMDAQWSDDFHHALHTVLTGEGDGYYADFGTLEQLAAAYRDGWVYQGAYSRFRRRRHGVPADGLDRRRFVVFAQNHDQSGNRMRGERLASLVDEASLRLAAGAVLLSPFVPLLFMGEEHGEDSPFQYFVSHGDPALVEAVRSGRANEFAAFGWTGEVPDPQAEETFLRSRLDRAAAGQPERRGLRALYAELLRLRREVPALRPGGRVGNNGDDAGGFNEGAGGEEPFLDVRLDAGAEAITLHRRRGTSEAFIVLAFAREGRTAELPLPAGQWRLAVDSSAPRWRGRDDDPPEPAVVRSGGGATFTLAPRSFLLLSRIAEG
jgi:maltooligosyltrehalose trehalohydrolase